MSKSIMQRKDGTCFLCRYLHGNDGCYSYIEEHHVVFGSGRRRVSEHYGLKVYLCKEHHKQGGMESPHGSRQISDLLCEIAQKTFESIYGNELWMQEFGKNYIKEEKDDKDTVRPVPTGNHGKEIPDHRGSVPDGFIPLGDFSQ